MKVRLLLQYAAAVVSFAPALLPAQTISTIAGNGTLSGGDGGVATAAGLNSPAGVAVDTAGNIFIADFYNHRVRKVSAATGVITTVAGGNGVGFSGDGGLATNARLYFPISVGFDSVGNLYIADQYNHRIRKVDAATGLITTAGGTGVAGFNGDNIAATAARLHYPAAILFDPNDNLYIADYFNHRIRKISSGTGVITTVAGTGLAGFSGEGTLAVTARLNYPLSLAFDASGNLYFGDEYNERIRKIDLSTGYITTVAGTGIKGYSGDGGQATSAKLNFPAGVAVDSVGNIYIADYFNHALRKVAAATNIITTVAGSGLPGFGGDGGLAANARLQYPFGIMIGSNGELVFSDQINHRIRKIVVDSTPPAISPTVSGVLGDNGWYVSDVTVAWGVTDGESALHSQSGCGLSSVTSDTVSTTFTCQASSAGGTSTESVTIKRDATSPVVTASRAPDANSYGWNNSPVTVSFNGTDDSSGIANCSADIVLTDGASQSATGSCTDRAGNVSPTSTVSDIDVDTVSPAVTLSTPSSGASYLLNASVLAGYACTDGLSGIASCTGDAANGGAVDTSSVGSFEFGVLAADKAANSASETNAYAVKYGLVGFMHPVDNLPILNGVTAGRTIPIKWQLVDANGASLSNLSTFRSLGSMAVVCASGSPLDDIEEVVAAGGSVLRFDAAANQFIYNWATSSSWKGKCRRLVLELADGQKKEAQFKFK